MLNRSASLAMSTSVLKALPGKLDIKRHSPSILYISVQWFQGSHMRTLTDGQRTDGRTDGLMTKGRFITTYVHKHIHVHIHI